MHQKPLAGSSLSTDHHPCSCTAYLIFTFFAETPLPQLLLWLLLMSAVARLHMGFNQAAEIIAAVSIKLQAAIIRQVPNFIKVIQQAAASGSGALICQPEPGPWHPSQLRQWPQLAMGSC